MESIKQIKVDLSNKREETTYLCGKTSRWENIHGKRPLILDITLQITSTWDPYNSHAHGWSTLRTHRVQSNDQYHKPLSTLLDSRPIASIYSKQKKP
jgi:hypothetical protein